jgi:hypothetical protein
MNTRSKALEVAQRFIGVRENPAGSNNGFWVGKFLREGGGIEPPAPWCAAFVCYCYKVAGRPLTFPNRASVGFFRAWMEKNGYLVDRPLKGDIVCYNFDSDDWPDHIGIVERVLALRWRDRLFVGWIQVVEGNTSLTNQADGGRVMRRRRWANRCVFGRIP